MKSINLFLILLLAFSCNQQSKKGTELGDNQQIMEDIPDKLPLSPLIEGEFLLKDGAFGDIIELTGLQHTVNRIFKVGEIEMIAEDSFLIVKNQNDENYFMAFSLPDFRFIKSFGRMGRGPLEFQFPHFVKSNDDNAYSYVYEWRGNKLWMLDKSLEIKELGITIPKDDKVLFDKQFYSLSDSNYYYVASTKQGKAVFQLQFYPDSLTDKLFYNLSFSKEHRNWASYIGDFGVNKEKNRMVYAYKYFKRLVFIDTGSKKTRTLIFDEEEAKKKDVINMLGPDNVTHYWGMSAQKNYVYVLYSGRTPIVVSKELKKGPGYIYVELFDYNGNPVHKYRLDHWGFFCVSKDEKTIYLASITEEQPFYCYDIPKDN